VGVGSKSAMRFRNRGSSVGKYNNEDRRSGRGRRER